MKKRFTGILLAIIMILSSVAVFPMSVAAGEALSSASDWATKLYPEDAGITFDNVIGGGSMYSGVSYTVNGNTTADTLVLTTNAGLGSNQTTMAGTSVSGILAGLSGYGFGAHLSYVEVETTAPSKKLTFNYAFCSCEFDQSPSYNDSFALLYSVKKPGSDFWSDYTNVAVISDVGAVNIQNLKSANKWTANGSISGSNADTEINSKSGKGFTEFFEAIIEDIVPGSKIRVLFAICDISDSSFDSAVIIEAGSFKFTNAIVDYDTETIYNLTPGETYTVTFPDGSSVDVTADNDGKIPMAFTVDGEDYSLIGKSFAIEVAGSSSIPQQISIAGRPDAPESPLGPDENPAAKPGDIPSPGIEPDTTSLTVVAPVEGQEYSIDGGKTWTHGTGSGSIAFTGLTPNTEYAVITRVSATANAPASLPSAPVKVKTLPLPETYSVSTTDYNAPYDGAAHSATVSVSDTQGAEIRYSAGVSENYTSENPAFTDVGEYTVYYSVTHPDFYPSYGTVTVTITRREVTVSGITAKDRGFEEGKKSVDLVLDNVKFDGLVDGDVLSLGVSGAMDDDKAGEGKNVSITYMFIGGANVKNYRLVTKDSQTSTTVNISHVGGTEIRDAKEATCFEEGYTGDTYCKGCGELLEKGTVIDKIPHTPSVDWDYDETDHWHKCSVIACGVVVEETKAEHTFTWVTDKEPTEDETGLKHEQCTVCGYVRNENTEIDKLPHTHNLVHTDAVASTCKDPGNIEFWNCTKCGKFYTDAEAANEITEDQTVAPIDPSNHVGETEVRGAKDATCYEEGYTGDTYCTSCDTVLENGSAIDKLAHTPSEEWSFDETDHWHVCTVTECGAVLDETKAEHTFTWKVDQAATEEETGMKHEECTVCGYVRSENTVIDKLDHTHDLVHTDAVEATCKDTGIVEYWKCTKCGKYYTDEDAANEITEDQTVAAVDPSNHVGETEVRDAKDATCTEDGCTGDTYCTSCGAKIADGEIIPAKGHTFEDGKCIVCGADDPDQKPEETEKTEEPTSPQTGDVVSIWIALMTVSAGAVVGTAVYGKKRNEAE